MKLQQRSGRCRSHGPPAGVHTGAGGAVDELESEDVCAGGVAVDDAGSGLEELGMVEDAAGDELGVEELDVELDRLWDEVRDEATDDETALQFPKPCWHPVPQ
jgi:hypothetical protein